MNRFWVIGLICAGIGVTILLYMRFIQRINRRPFHNLWLDKTDTGEYNIDIMKKFLDKTVQIFKHLNIRPVLAYGSLLGYARDDGLIPWDDDMDMGLTKDEIKLVLDNKSLFNRQGIDVIRQALLPIIKLCPSTLKRINPITRWSWPFIDLFTYTEDRDLIVLDETHFSSQKFPMKNWYPLKPVKFLDIDMYVPNKTNLILDDLYGDTWSKTCVSSPYNHRNEFSYRKTYKMPCDQVHTKYSEKDLFSNVWVINLDNRPERWSTTRDRLRTKNIEPLRWSATDAKSKDFETKYKLKKPSIKQGEAACFDSHLNLWKHLWNTKVPIALIFEDDAVLGRDVDRKKILDAVNKSPGFVMILIGYNWSLVPPFTDPITTVGTGVCLHAYIVNRPGLEILINKATDSLYKKPIDHITREIGTKELVYIGYHVVPSIDPRYAYGQGMVHQDISSGSDIRDQT